MAGRPLLVASLAFVAGVALGAWLPQEPAAWGWASAATLVAWTALLAARREGAATRLGLAAFAVLGICRVQGDLAPLYAGGVRLAEGDAVAGGRIGRPAEFRDGQAVLHLDEVRLRRDGATFSLPLPLQAVVEGGGGERYAVGDRVTVRGKLRLIRGDRNLGWFPGPVTPRGRRYAARLVAASPAWVRVEGHERGSGPNAVVLRWRAAADAFWKSHPGAAGEILNSLTTGERAGIPAAVQEAFQRSGLTHLLAISGMNVGFLAALVFLALRRLLALWPALALRHPVQPIAAALSLPALWFFMLFSGSQIPVGRAVLMSAAGMAAVILWRRVNPADAWALAALAIVSWDPRALFSASFQLSFAAVAALVLVAPRLSVPLDGAGAGTRRRLCRGARNLFVISLAASAATAPLVAFHFQQLSLVGPLANLIAVPFTGIVVLPAGWLALLSRAVWAPAGELVAQGAAWSAARLVDFATWFATPSWAAVRTARPPLLFTACLVGMAATLLPRPTARLRWAALGACTAAALAGTWWGIATHQSGLLVAVLDVGQGLAAAVRLPGGGSLLYDAGPRWGDYDAGERIVVPALRRLGVTRLDVLAVSHPHPDHAGGAGAVMRDIGAARVWVGGGAGPPKRGTQVALAGGVRIQVLNPPRAGPHEGPAQMDENDRSLALLVSLGDTGLLLAGDAGPAAVGGIAAAIASPPAHLALQVPHHGGSPEACRTLAAVLGPELSVISVGRNTYGHPRPAAVAALEAHGRVSRTDRDGAVFVRSDRARLESRTWRELANGRTWPERVRWLAAGW